MVGLIDLKTCVCALKKRVNNVPSVSLSIILYCLNPYLFSSCYIGQIFLFPIFYRMTGLKNMTGIWNCTVDVKMPKRQ